ncbi:hypothetical protein [Faecalimicrobium dakarense]|uniref:hypothetical protein n=1 Tax=Faecalimicrobium dakarense TaxID=1301100 RepID=UPI0004B1E0DE|nr:hypothetical protein [[Clostridium] dakarense]
MKKLELKQVLLILLTPVLVLTSGCENSASVEKASSLKEGYFKIAKHLDDKEEVNKDYIESLLSGFKYEKGDELKMGGDSSDIKMTQRQYIFKDDKEELIITHTIYNGYESMSPVYIFSDEDININLSYTPKANKELVGEKEEAKPKLFVGISLPNNTKYQEICKLLNDNYTDYESYYQNIANKFASENNMDIKELKDIIDKKPYQSEIKKIKLGKSTEEESISYTFKNDTESICVQFLKDSNKMYELSYMNLDEFGNNIVKTVRDNKTLHEGEFHMDITNSSSKLDKQIEIINKIDKYIN